MNVTPLLTVAMPVFNAGHHLPLAVFSILNQTFKDWQLIIYDDGSSDNSLDFLSEINDSRISILSDGTNKGIAARLNEIIGMTQSEYFARMDGDDVSYPERFAKQIEFLQKNRELDVIAVGAIAINDDNHLIRLLPCPVSHEAICAKPWQGFCFAHPTWMGKTEWFKKFRYTIPGPYFCEDQELLLRSYISSRFTTLDEILFAYRIRQSRNIRKVIKTNWTFLDVKVRHFFLQKMFSFALLAVLFHLALFIRDIWWELRKKIISEKSLHWNGLKKVKFDWQVIYENLTIANSEKK